MTVPINLVGCGGGSAAPSGPAGVPTMDPQPADAPNTPTAEPAAFVPPAIPSDGVPANHYLGADIVLMMQSPYIRNHAFARAATVVEPPTAPGAAAMLWDFNKKEQVETKYYWKTHAARADEVVPGMLVAAHWKRDKETLVAPKDATEAHERPWIIARVVSIRSLKEGYVLLAGGLLAPPATLRILDDDPSPRLERQGSEDRHFLGEEHMFVSKQPLPNQRHMFVHASLPLKPDAPLSDGGQGKFVHVSDGEVVMVPHAWRTRLATAKDLKAGAYVFAPHLRKDGVHRAPTTRNEALKALWLVVKIEDPKGKKKGTIIGEGKVEIEIDALRVPIE
ncbi:MAG TPA: hypothetical protein PKA88_02470 [Polyangiaceae bacterium]|nr:hypothetical protein [Polyangiaceae bacterium]